MIIPRNYRINTKGEILQLERICAKCEQCGKEQELSYAKYLANKRRGGLYTCRKCGPKLLYTEDRRAKTSALMKSRWHNEEYRKAIGKKISEAQTGKIRNDVRERWADPKYKEKVKKAIQQGSCREETRKRKSENSKKMWKKEEFRNKVLPKFLSSSNKRKLTIKRAQELGQKRGFICLSEVYINNSIPMEWQCQDKHQWWSSYANISQGNGCPYCSGSMNEEKIRFIFEQLFKKDFPKNRQIIKPLEIDGFNNDLWLGFEYHGYQHFQISHFDKSEEQFLSRLERDNNKIIACKNSNIKLIVISYAQIKDEKQLKSFIGDQLDNLNVDYSKENLYNISLGKFTGKPSKLRVIQEIIERKNGKMLHGSFYTSSFHKTINLQCHCGHQWMTCPDYIKQGYWCPKCANKYPVDIAYVTSLAQQRNFKFLSTSCGKMTNKYLWQCNICNHQWMSTISNIKAGKGCPLCNHGKIYTIEEINNVANKKGLEFMSLEFSGIRKAYKWKCKYCNIIQTVTANSILRRKSCCMNKLCINYNRSMTIITERRCKKGANT